ncbi:MAG: phosphoribosylglycinamide formyltransferase [Desulfatibacillaceae bacterium]|nr:phosphoribosylglycinamide formyltransferase [Desulfatibacillaceae bacterium]
MSKKICRIGALISGGGSNLQAVLDACAAKAIDAKVVVVGADNPEAFGLSRAKKAGVPTFVADYGAILAAWRKNPFAIKPPPGFDAEKILARQKLFSNDNRQKALSYLTARALCEAAVLEKMPPDSVDLVILAGFMRVVTPYFIDAFNTDPAKPRIMNIHPALLPSFPGVDGYGDTFSYGCKVAGATVHFVDYGEDTGPIIGQKCFAILPEDDLESVKKKGLALEWQLYQECINLFAQNRLQVTSKRQADGSTRKTVTILPKQ